MKCTFRTYFLATVVAATSLHTLLRPNVLSLGLFLNILTLLVLIDCFAIRERKLGIYVAAFWLLVVDELTKSRCNFFAYTLTLNLLSDFIELHPFPLTQSLAHEVQAFPIRLMVLKFVLPFALIRALSFMIDSLNFYATRRREVVESSKVPGTDSSDSRL